MEEAFAWVYLEVFIEDLEVLEEASEEVLVDEEQVFVVLV